MAEKKKKPEIRFNDFTDDWEQHKLGKIIDLRSGRDYKHLSEGDIPVYGTGGYMLSVNEALSYKEDAIGIGRKGTIDKPYILKAPFWTVDTLFYAVPNANSDLDFIYDIFQNINWKQKDESTGVPSLSKSAINEIDVLIPKYKEQKIVGSFFGNIDNLITLNQREYDKLIIVKKSMLEKMLPKDGRNVPEIRFDGFNGPWEQRKFEELVTPYSDQVSTPTDGYFRLGIRSHAKGTFHSYVKPGKELATAQMHKVAADKFIVNITFGWEHAVAITTEYDVGKLVSHRFPQFSFNEGNVPNYFKYLILDEKFRHHLLLSSPGGAGRNRVLNLNQMLEYKFWITSKEEQERIAAFMEQLDSLINLQQLRIEKLRNIKASCMKKMFI